MTTNNQGVGTRELALMILLEIERGEKSHIVLRHSAFAYLLMLLSYMLYHRTTGIVTGRECYIHLFSIQA